MIPIQGVWNILAKVKLKYRENKRNIWYNQEKKINLQTNGTSCFFLLGVPNV